jgi:acyl-CoA thioesterase
MMTPPQTHFATIDMGTKFLYPVKKGLVTAKAEVSKRDGRNLQGTAIIYDDEGRAVLEFLSTFKVAKNSVIRGISFGGSD